MEEEEEEDGQHDTSRGRSTHTHTHESQQQTRQIKNGAVLFSFLLCVGCLFLLAASTSAKQSNEVQTGTPVHDQSEMMSNECDKGKLTDERVNTTG